MTVNKMNPEIKKLWLEALRDPKARQCTGKLEDMNGANCPLGLLARLYQKQFPEDLNIYPHTDKTYIVFVCKSKVFPLSMIKWAGLKDEFNPNIKYNNQICNVADLNDTFRLNFSQIADIIEEQL